MNRLLYILFLFTTLISCSKKDNPFTEPENEEKKESEIIDSSYVGYNMYFLKNENLTGSEVTNTNINEFELQKPPFVTQENIQYYDTSSHVIQLFESIELPEMGVPVLGKPFVVATDSFRHYVGVIWPMYSSSSYHGPVIDVMPRFYPKDIVKISMGRAQPPAPDFRLNDTIIETLKNYDVFHAGITCKIDTVEIIENDSETNHCKLRYTFTIKNNDEFRLYVFDPLIMGDSLFHYYHNGVYFRTPENIYQSISGSQAPGEDDNPLNWLIKIDNGESVTRTVVKGGYPFIPDGTYECGFRLSGLNSIGKSNREKPDGRVWIGEVHSKRLITLK